MAKDITNLSPHGKYLRIWRRGERPAPTLVNISVLRVNPYSAELIFHKSWRPKGFNQFEIIINSLVHLNTRGNSGPQKSVPSGHTQSKCYVPFWTLMCPCSFRTRYQVGVFLNINCFRLYHSRIFNVGEGDFTLLFIIMVYTVS